MHTPNTGILVLGTYHKSTPELGRLSMQGKTIGQQRICELEKQYFQFTKAAKHAVSTSERSTTGVNCLQLRPTSSLMGKLRTDKVSISCATLLRSTSSKSDFTSTGHNLTSC